MDHISDDDLEYLHGILRRMDGEEEIQIGVTHWSVSDILSVVQMALQLGAFQAAGRIT